jgi:anti-sigma28 factor (negative regulator of flagellin synthesis)
MRINAITQPLQSELRKVENARKNEKASSAGRSVPVDRSEISAGAQRLSSTKASMDVITSTLDSQADVRTDKISEIQEKIKNGYYDSPEFIDKLAVKLLAEFGIKEPL